MASFSKGTSFTDGVTGDVTAAKLHALVDAATPVAGLVTDRTAKTSVVGADLVLLSDSADSNNLKKVSVTNFANNLPTAKITTGTIDTATLGTTTGTLATLTNASITTGTIATATLGTTIGTAARFTTGTLTTGLIPTGTFGTTTSTAATITTGTVTNLNSTSATITTGTIPTLVSTTSITSGTGSASTPAISPTGDTNTGVFFPAADTIAFAEGGAEAMRINASGTLCIGTTSDTSGGAIKLRISDGTIDSCYGYKTGGVEYAGTISNHPYVVLTNNTERLRIDSSGRVGIGLTPTSRNNTRLQIVDGIGFPATQVASSDANTLDDYEEGTWTPTLDDASNCSSLTVTGAWYIKIGGLVTYSITGAITVTSSNTKTSFSFTHAFAQRSTTDSQGGSALIEGPPPYPYAAGNIFDYGGATSKAAVLFGASAVDFNGTGTYNINGSFKAD